MTFEKNALKVTENIHYYKVLVTKYLKNTPLVADLGITFSYYYKVTIWKGHLKTKIEKCEIFIQMANSWCKSSLKTTWPTKISMRFLVPWTIYYKMHTSLFKKDVGN